MTIGDILAAADIMQLVQLEAGCVCRIKSKISECEETLVDLRPKLVEAENRLRAAYAELQAKVTT